MNPIFKFLAKRVLFGVLTLFVVSVLIFALMHAVRGDAAKIFLGREATPEAIKELRTAFRLDRPLVSQYSTWITGAIRGDFGRSFVTRGSVWADGSPRLGASLFLLLVAGLVSVPVSIAFGSYSALHRDQRFDSVSSIVTLVLASIPEFVVGSLLVFVFATNIFHVLPATASLFSGDPPWSNPKGLVLAVVVLVLAVFPYVSRVTRASVIEVLDSDYIEMARLKGMPERTVLWRHALPNALGPVFQVIALNLAYLAGGVIVVEWLFNYPGIGSALNEAVRARNLPVVQFYALAIATVYVVMNLLADIATVLVTPRLRTSLT